MHPYTLFISCMDVLKVTNVDLMDVLHTPKIRGELKALEDLFTNHIASTDPGKKLQVEICSNFQSQLLYEHTNKELCVLCFSASFDPQNKSPTTEQ